MERVRLCPWLKILRGVVSVHQYGSFAVHRSYFASHTLSEAAIIKVKLRVIGEPAVEGWRCYDPLKSSLATHVYGVQNPTVWQTVACACHVSLAGLPRQMVVVVV